MSEKEYDPHEAVDFLYRHAPIYAQAKANRVYMEEYRKSKKALLMRESGLSSVAAQEVYAYAHPDYIAHLAALKEAVVAEIKEQWQLVAAQTRFDAWRTQEASNRALDKATR